MFRDASKTPFSNQRNLLKSFKKAESKMLVPLSWLQDYIPLSMSSDELAEILTLAGLEVDKVEHTTFSFAGVVVGEIINAKKHPGADKLTITQVSDGKETFQVVCGDPNCQIGMRTAFAKIGAHLTDDSGSTFKIKHAKLRDVESFGMLCTEQELGLSDHHETIMQLPPDAPLGTDLTEIFGDTIIEISLTPNLGHCMSMLGIARDLAAMIDSKATCPSFKLQENADEKNSEAIGVEIKNPEACFRYSCRLIRNVKIGPSPIWLKKRLEAAGVRSINNIVDVTNYVMLSVGQPMHAFDYEKIGGKKISVQLAEKEISFKTLDGEKRKVPEGTLMIYDQTKPVAIAGVMGGAESEVQESSSHVLLESAHFCPSYVRKASKGLNLRSESSSRFERGIDHEGVTKALDQAAYLIQKVGGGDIVEGLVDVVAKPRKDKKLKCRIKRVNEILGTALSNSEIESFLLRLEMDVEAIDEETLEVIIPSYRNDIHQEIDLIEEVARIYGYNNIQKGEGRVINSPIPHTPMYLVEQEIRRLLLREGLQEFLTCDLISPKLSELSLEKGFSKNEAIHVLHPSSVDQSILRTSLLPGLLQAVKHNFDRQNTNISAFEIGRVHFKDGEQFRERTAAALVMTGKRSPHYYEGKGADVDFFDLKGILENILEGFGVTSPSFSFSSLKSFHPGKQATLHIGSVRIGVLGEVHPERLEVLDIQERVFFAQLDLSDLFELHGGFKQMTPLPQFPGSDRDWTLTLKKEVPIDSVMQQIGDFKSKLLKDFFLLDLYENEKIGTEYKNITLRFTYRDDKKTIEQAQVEKEHARLIDTVSRNLELDT